MCTCNSKQFIKWKIYGYGGYYGEEMYIEEVQEETLENTLIEFDRFCNSKDPGPFEKVELIQCKECNYCNTKDEIIKTFEQDLLRIEEKCITCQETSVYFFKSKNEADKNFVNQHKKLVSPCNGTKENKDCICGECEFFYCDDCMDSEVMYHVTGYTEENPVVYESFNYDLGLTSNVYQDIIKEIETNKRELEEALFWL